MSDFTPYSALAGGALIGLAAAILFVFNGRIAGVSGIVTGLLPPSRGGAGWRLAFLIGLIGGALAYGLVVGAPHGIRPQLPSWLTIGAGLAVGYGTALGSGCTSGHGVCGISRLSRRSLVATGVFMASAVVTVFVIRHLIGGLA